MRVIGLAGWSSAGKGLLLTRLIGQFSAQGLRVATVKRTHHRFEIDRPGRESYAQRRAGAGEVIVSSARRWVQIRENGPEGEAPLAMLLRRVSPCDLVLVDGFKRATHPKIEVFREEDGRDPLHPEDSRIVAVASDRPFPDARVPVLGLDDVEAIAALALARCEPLAAVLERLEADGHA